VRQYEWDVGLKRLISLIHPRNRASIRVAEKIGEQYDKDVTTGARNPARLYVVEADSLGNR